MKLYKRFKKVRSVEICDPHFMPIEFTTGWVNDDKMSDEDLIKHAHEQHGDNFQYILEEKFIPYESQEPSEDVISRQAVLNMQYRIDDSATLSTRDVVNVDDIEDLPPITLQPKIGHWINNQNGTFTCDICGCKHSKSNYCHNCGAKMIEPKESEEK